MFKREDRYVGALANKCVADGAKDKISNLISAIAYFYPEHAIPEELYASAESVDDIDYAGIASGVDVNSVYIGTLDPLRSQPKFGTYRGITDADYGDIKMLHGWFLAYRALLCPQAYETIPELQEGWVSLDTSRVVDPNAELEAGLTGDLFTDILGPKYNTKQFSQLAKIEDKHIAKSKKIDKVIKKGQGVRENPMPGVQDVVDGAGIVYKIYEGSGLGETVRDYLFGKERTTQLFGVNGTELPFSFWSKEGYHQSQYWKDVWAFVGEVNRLVKNGLSLSDAFEDLQMLSEIMYTEDPNLTDFNQKYVKYALQYKPGIPWEVLVKAHKKCTTCEPIDITRSYSHYPNIRTDDPYAWDRHHAMRDGKGHRQILFDMQERVFGDFVNQTISAINIAPAIDRNPTLFDKTTPPLENYLKHTVNNRGYKAYFDREAVEENKNIRNWWTPSAFFGCRKPHKIEEDSDVLNVLFDWEHKEDCGITNTSAGSASYFQYGKTAVFKGQVEALIAVYCSYPEARVTLIKNGVQFALELLIECPDEETVELLLNDPNVSEELKAYFRERLSDKDAQNDYDNRKLLPTALAFIGLGTLVGATFLRGYRNYKNRR